MSASEQEVATACLALINAQLSSYGGGSIHALDLDDARGITAEHVQFALSARYVESERGGMTGLCGYRATTRPVATTVTNGRELARRVYAAFNDIRVVAGGQTSTPIHLESADAIGEDDGYYSGLSTWTFVL